MTAPLLAFVFGPRRGVTLSVARRLVVGRGAEADVLLLDEKVSREHCAFTTADGALFVEDLGSRNGTWVNGERLSSPRRLESGDTVGIGETLVMTAPDVEALRAKDGESTLVLSNAPLGLTTTAASEAPDGVALAGRLVLEAALATDATQAAEQLSHAVVEGLRCDEALVCARGSEGQLKPIAAWPRGASVALNLHLASLALQQERSIAAEQTQVRARHDAQTTTVVRQRAFVLCAPLPRRQGVVVGVRPQAFDSRELALAGVLATAGAPALKLDAPVTVGTTATTVVAESAPMKLTVEQATRAAASNATVLLTGESGSGKEAVARLIHERSRRAARPFVALNCGAIPESIAESELFGHEKGAFTGATATHAGVFERADGGTLFLDEVGELPLALQVKLLRVLEEKLVWRLGARTPLVVDVRLLAATNRELEQSVEKGSFRSDLFYRLNVVRLTLEPLRQRREDVLPLAHLALAKHASSLGRPTPSLSPEAERALLGCDWPGNVRQLSNALERALVLKADDGPVTLADLPAEVVSPSQRSGGSAAPARSLGDLVATLEREQIVLAMKRARGVKVQAAEALGISRPTLDRKLTEYGIDWLDA